MAIKLPITLEELQKTLDSLGSGRIEVTQNNTTRFTFLGSIIDLYHSTGTYKNVNTGRKGQGMESLVNYLNYLAEIKNTKQNSPKSSNNEDIVNEMMNRITLLENRLESLSERLTIMDEVLRNII